MITKAKDLKTGVRVLIEDAAPGKPYACMDCGVTMFPVQGSERQWFFRCAKELHRRSNCFQRSNNCRRIHDADSIVPERFFEGLYANDIRGPIGPPVDPPVIPPVFPPKDIEESDDVEIVPCRTLRQLWSAGVADLPHDMPIGKGVLSDLIIKKKDFWRYLNSGNVLNNRILKLMPIKYSNEERVIVFVAKWGKKISANPARYENREAFFLLKFQDQNVFNSVWNDLFKWDIQENGTPRLIRLVNAALVAGHWRACTADELRKCSDKLDENYVSVQIAECTSKKLVYAISR